MSTPEERIAGDLIRRGLRQTRHNTSVLLGFKNQEINDSVTAILDQIERTLPEASDNQDLLMVSPGPESIEAALLREQAKDFGTVHARTVSVATMRNLRRRMAEPTHPWFGCTLEAEEVEGKPNMREIFLTVPQER